MDFYYDLGALINLYSHTLSTGLGDAGQLVPDYITYSLNTNLHPRLWSANAVDVYQWWLQRSNAQFSVSYSTNGNQSVTTVSITGASDTNTSVEVSVPANGSASGLQVLTNNVLAGGSSYRTNGPLIRIRVGTAITNVQARFVLAPKAQTDIYSVPSGTNLVVSAPGILGNDGAGTGTNLTALLLTAPANGFLTLSSNGGFSYTSIAGFVGTDSFTYAATDEQTNSASGTVLIAVSPPGALFADNFSRAQDRGPLSPWIAQSGAWMLSGGLLQAGPNIQQLYGYACLTNTWTNYSVEARVRFPTTSAWGAGIGGYLNPATGAHYALWLYPGGSPGASNILRLIKFQSWSSFAYNGAAGAPMQQVSVGPVGTNWHTLQLAFRGSQIVAYYDTNQVMSVTDVEAQPYSSGGISVATWTQNTPYAVYVDDVVVRPLPPAIVLNSTALVAEGCPPANNVIDPGETVVVSFALKNTSLIATEDVVATLLPTNGVVAPDGPQSYGALPIGGGIVTRSFTFTATGPCGSNITPTLQLQDGALNLGTVSTVYRLGLLATVLTQNFDTVTGPTLPPGWTSSATGAQSPWFTTNSLYDTPSNAVHSIAAADMGVNELVSPQIPLPEGPATLSFRHRYSFESDPSNATNGYDGGVLEIKIGTNSFIDITNGGSWVANGYNRKIDSLYQNPLTNRWAWSGTNGGFVTTTVTLPAAAAGQMIQLRWRAGADNANDGGGWWVDTASISGYVCCANTNTTPVTNTAPVLPVQPDRTVNELAAFSVTNTATDAESPPQVLIYSLLVAPTNAVISANGVITWTPVEAEGPGAYTFTTVVSDNAVPSLERDQQLHPHRQRNELGPDADAARRPDHQRAGACGPPTPPPRMPTCRPTR